MKKLICVIPALEKNNYSDKGDLIEWGGTTLIEWKISQALKVNNIEKIVITTPSLKIKSIVKSYPVDIILRKKSLSLGNMYKFIGQKFLNKNILWLNPTAPFLSDRHINKFISKFFNLPKKYDSSFTCIELREFLLRNNNALNFSIKKLAISRKKIDSIFKCTNGAYIVSSNHMKKFGNLYGKNHYLFQIPWLQSLEVKSSSELENFRFFMSKYMKENI